MIVIGEDGILQGGTREGAAALRLRGVEAMYDDDDFVRREEEWTSV